MKPPCIDGTMAHRTKFARARGPTSRGVCMFCGLECIGQNAQQETRYGFYNRETRRRHGMDLSFPGWRDGFEPQNLGEAARAWRP